MSTISVEKARSFVDRAELPPLVRTRDAAARDLAAVSFDTAKSEAAVVGSGIVSFVSGITTPRRESLVNSTLLAQLVANKAVPDRSDVDAWYGEYFDALANVGWVVQQKDFAEYHEASQNFEAHEAVLAVATTLLGSAPTALALVKTTLDSLRSMDQNKPWITLFDKESRTAKTAHFQITLVDQDAAGQFLVTLMAFGLEASSTITQVLFFKIQESEATLRHRAGKVTINVAVLDALHDPLQAKLVAHSLDYVAKLPDLGV